jgi:hypothetical protein
VLVAAAAAPLLLKNRAGTKRVKDNQPRRYAAMRRALTVIVGTYAAMQQILARPGQPASPRAGWAARRAMDQRESEEGSVRSGA